MNILIGFEESQVVTEQFLLAGHNSLSCDIKPGRKNLPHFHGDIYSALNFRDWDLIILHPPCDFMAVCGNRWHAGTQRRLDAIAWTLDVWEQAKKQCPRVALENPNSVIFPHLRKTGAKVFYTQPHEHGHGETKKTGFAVHNLPIITPTNNVEGREQRVWKMPPSETRKRDRSETYEGIAKAMVKFWG